MSLIVFKEPIHLYFNNIKSCRCQKKNITLNDIINDDAPKVVFKCFNEFKELIQTVKKKAQKSLIPALVKSLSTYINSMLTYYYLESKGAQLCMKRPNT